MSGISKDSMNQKNTIKERICYLYENELYTDVRFMIGPKDGTDQDEFPAHKAILAAGSTVFASMFYSGKEIKPSISYIQITPEITFDGFGNLLEYLYTDDVYLEDPKEALETYDAASKFMVLGLREKCEKFLLSVELSPQTLCKLLETVSPLNIQSFRTRCLQEIEKNTQQVIQSECFKAASFKTIKSIMKLKRVSVQSESDLFHALMEWASLRAQQLKSGLIKSKVREIAGPLFTEIRFLSMSFQEFSSCIKSYPGLLTEKEALEIMMHIAEPGSSQIPIWCNRSGARTFLRVESIPSPPFQTFAVGLTNTKTNMSCNYDIFSIAEIRSKIDDLKIRGIKLAWKEDRTYSRKERSLEYAIIAVIKNNNFTYKEGSQIVQNDLGVAVKFTKPLKIRKGFVVSISVKIIAVRGFTFFTYDTQQVKNNSNLPFSCNFQCLPLDSFFYAISEIYYDELGDAIQEGADAALVAKSGRKNSKKKTAHPLANSCFNLQHQ